MKKLYEIVWCYIDDNGAVETDEYEQEKYWVSYIKANHYDEAERLWVLRQNFRRKPEIVEFNEYVKTEK